MSDRSVNGAGVGLRPVHVPYILEQRPAVPWFEILIDNFLYGDRDAAYRVLEQIRANYPVAFHSVGLDVGSVEPINASLLRDLTNCAREFQPAFVSTHLCWTASAGYAHHDLLPLPFTEEAVAHCAARIQKFQDALGEQILIENISAYMRTTLDALSEGEFLRAVAEAADCYLLIDINNLYINDCNHREDGVSLEQDFFQHVPRHRIRQYHLAGFEDRNTHLLDTHGAPVADPVWELFARALNHWGPAPTCIERDANLPPEFQELFDEVLRAQEFLDRCN